MEVSGDVETAVVRISEGLFDSQGVVVAPLSHDSSGHAEQWGNVSRKKDKKSGGAISPSPSGMATGAPTHRERDSSRGGHRGAQRGGRGGRGGGRGGSFTGRNSSRGQSVAPTVDLTPAQVTNTDWANEPTNGASPGDAWGTDATTSTWSADATTSAWAEETVSAPETKVEQAEPQAPVPVSTNGVSKTTTPTLAPVKATPVVGAVRSWAQVARLMSRLLRTLVRVYTLFRPQEKPKPVPPQPQVQQEEPVPAPQPENPQPEPEHEQEKTEEAVWEEPTTAQSPVWDEEPARVSAHDKLKAESKENSWKKEPEPSPSVREQAPPAEAPSPPVDQSTPALTSDTSSTVPSSVASPTPPPTNKAPTSRTASSRVASRFKPDQAVVMPSFGSVGSGIGIGGMKFGSLSINDNGDDFDE